MLNDTQVRAYLQRIGYTGEPTHGKSTLDELVWCHQRSVPFETLTMVRRGKEPSLALETIYEKVVERRLGGYCFELNKLFEALLEALGFEVRPVLSRAVRGRNGRMAINHRGIIVYADEGACSVDVGFGGPMPAGALLLSHGVEQTVRGEVYTPWKTDHAWWKIERITRAECDFFDDSVPERRQVELELCTAKVEDIDFEALNLAWARPGTKFHDHEIVNLRTESGYLGYFDGVLTERVGAQKTVSTIAPEDAPEAMARYFGLERIDEAVAEGFLTCSKFWTTTPYAPPSRDPYWEGGASP